MIVTDTQDIATADLADYLGAIKRRRMLLAIIALPIVCVAAALAVGLPNIYISSGLLTFTDATVPGEMKASTETDAIRRQQEEYRDAYVDSLSSSVLSSTNLKRLIAAVPEVRRPGMDLSDTISRIVSRTHVQTVRTSVMDPNTGRDRQIISAFTVSYDSRNPKLAAAVAGWLTQQFLIESRSGRIARAKAAAQFYSGEMQRYRQQIAATETKLAAFKAKNYDQLPGLTDLNMNIMQTTQRDLDNLTQQIQALRQNRIFLQTQLDEAKNAGDNAGLLAQLQAEYDKKLATYDPNYPDMIALRQQIDALRAGGGAINSLSLPAQLRAQEQLLAQAKLRYTNSFPDVQRIERQIKILKNRIAHGDVNAGNPSGSPAVVELKTQINANETQTQAYERQAAQLRQQLARLESRVEATPEVDRQYKALTLNLQLARTKYDQLLKSQMDAQLTSAAIASGRSDLIRIVQEPGVPVKPGKPKRTAIALVGVMLAILLGLTAVVIAESLDQTVRGSRDVRRVLSLAPLAVIPEIHDAAAASKQRWQVAILALSVVLGSAAVLMTVRIFYS
jgi:succinoglycan biosynthesis transport protein ExoP